MDIQQTALVSGFVLIGIPVAAFITLKLMKGYKRDVTAYEWSTAEVHRRGDRIGELEAALSAANARIHQLEIELKRYQKDPPKAPPQPVAVTPSYQPPPAEDGPAIDFEVGLFNQAVRDALAQGRKHKDLADSWSDISYFNIVATSEQAARDQIAKRYPPSRGYVIAAITRLKR